MEQKRKARRKENERKARQLQDHIPEETIQEEKETLLSPEKIMDRRKQLVGSPFLKDIDKKIGKDDISEQLLEDLSDDMRFFGVLVLRETISKAMLTQMATKATELRKTLCEALDRKGVNWKASSSAAAKPFRFYEIASRCKGRMDMRYQTSEAPFSNILEHPCLNKLMSRLLGGGGANLVYAGLIYNYPESDDQPWHQDGEPLFPEELSRGGTNLPPYAINVFLPLETEDASIEVGPTEFIPRSHRLREDQVMSVARGETLEIEEEDDEDAIETSVVAPILKQGDVVLYDYRVCHRGTKNLSPTRVRTMLYLMYARPWFKEHLNFGTEKLLQEE